MAKISGKDGKVLLGASVSITDAIGTTTIVVECTNPYSVGDRVFIEGVVGLTSLNGEHTVTAIDGATSFTVVVEESAQYTSGGTVRLANSITGWSLDLTGEVIKVTDSSNTTWDAYIASEWVGGSGSFEGFFEGSTNDLTIGATYPIILRMNSGNYYSFNGLITGNSSTLTVPDAEAVKKSYTFTSSDTITLTVA